MSTAVQLNNRETNTTPFMDSQDKNRQSLNKDTMLARDSALVDSSRVFARKRKRSKHPLRELRIRAGMTLEDLASAIGSSPSYLSRLESGARRLNSDTIERLSRALECTPAELLPPSSLSVRSSDSIGKSTASYAANSNCASDLPVFALDGSCTEMNLNKDVPDCWITRPVDLQGISDAFACIIRNSKWKPRYLDGEKLIIHPTAPLRPGTIMILTTSNNCTHIAQLVEYEHSTSSGLGMKIRMIFDENDQSKNHIKCFKPQDIKNAYRIIGTVEA